MISVVRVNLIFQYIALGKKLQGIINNILNQRNAESQENSQNSVEFFS